MTLALFLGVVIILLCWELWKLKQEWQWEVDRNRELRAAYAKVEADFVKMYQIAEQHKARVRDYSNILNQALEAAFKEEIDKYKEQVDEVNNESL